MKWGPFLPICRNQTLLANAGLRVQNYEYLRIGASSAPRGTW